MTRSRPTRKGAKTAPRRRPIPAPVAQEPPARPDAAREFDRYVQDANAQVSALIAVTAARRGVVRAEGERAAAVATARDAGASWREVGLAAHMTGRGAQKRWSTS